MSNSHSPSPRRADGLSLSVQGFSDEKMRCQVEKRSTPRWEDRVQPRVNEHPYRDEDSPREQNVPREGSPNFSLESMRSVRKYHNTGVRCKDLGPVVVEEERQSSPDGSGVQLLKSNQHLSHQKKYQRIGLQSSPQWVAGIEPEVVTHHYDGCPEAPNYSQKTFASSKKYHQTPHKASPRRERSPQVSYKPSSTVSNKMFAVEKAMCQVSVTNHGREVLL
eukprot:TRINITY_DN2938_c0_g2_i1.p1 TRINITY_DN2938_c0_g2~~TRINITY_DN2938_c0_g2_i1.p1  ORF type:complete len:220 (+),score=31.40 TRINITY_DN2938_c0_g2_i1:58-717(+)